MSNLKDSMGDSTSQIASIRLKKREDRRIRAGHLWVYSNEVDVAATPLKNLEVGGPVIVLADNGKVLGAGYVNPNSLICARLVSRDPKRRLDQSLLAKRLNRALGLRQRLFPLPYYRLVYGEADGLPGLIVDRFGDYLVVQCTTAGMERVKQEIIAALDEVLQPRAILLRNDSSIRSMEGLDSYVETIGELPDEVDVWENDVQFRAPLEAGQKTGWYYDHRDNRARMRRYTKDKKVLDLFSYRGAWGVQAAVQGAKEVCCVDSSSSALEGVGVNAALNGVQEQVQSRQGDVFEVLRELRQEQQRFDVVIVDPPAFIKRRKDHKKGIEAYRRLNRLAMHVLSGDGILVSASCSFHLTPEQLLNEVLQASRQDRRSLQLLERGSQAVDHPVHPAIPETEYLKTLFCRVTKE